MHLVKIRAGSTGHRSKGLFRRKLRINELITLLWLVNYPFG